MRSFTLAIVCLSISSLAACGGKQSKKPVAPVERDLDRELAAEAEAQATGQDASTAANTSTASKTKAEAPRARLVRFDLERGASRNGAGFRVLARETSDGGRVVAFEFDGTLTLGEERYEGSRFGGVALASYGADGALQWSRRLDHKDYHYVAALEVVEGGDILVGGSFGEHGMILTRISKTGEERWTFQPEKEPKWAEVSSFVVDKDGDVVLSGLFQAALRLPGAKPVKSRFFDGFVAKLDGATGALRWFEQLASAEAKASAVTTDESGAIFVAGDFRKFLRAGKKQLRGPRQVYIGRFSSDGKLEYLVPVKTGVVGNVIRVQPLEGERLAVHVRGEKSGEVVVVAQADGAVQWSVAEDGEGGALVYDARPRPDALYFAVHDADPRFGSARLMIREVKGDGEDDKKTVRVIDAGPHRFMGRATVRRTAKGEFLVAGSMRDTSWDNDGFYPFVVALDADAQRVDLGQVPAVGRGSGSRCQGTMAKKLVWRDLRAVVQQQMSELGKCVPDPGQYGATFELEADGTVKSVSIEGKTDDDSEVCLIDVLKKVRVCPFEGAPYTRRLGQLR